MFGNRRAVDVDEGATGAGAHSVNGPRDEALAGPGPSLEQQCRRTSSGRFDDLQDALTQADDTWTVAEDLGKSVHGRILPWVPSAGYGAASDQSCLRASLVRRGRGP